MSEPIKNHNTSSFDIKEISKPETSIFPTFPAYFKYVLITLPFIFFFLWLFCCYQNKAFFSSYPDSICIYLINATNIAGGNLDIGHYDNPGTPVHIIGGLVVFITHLLIGNPQTQER